MKPARWIFASAALAVVSAFGRPAHAERGAVWSVAVTGSACQEMRPELEREVSLACDAVGGTCRVAGASPNAELVAVVRCDEGDAPWTLETFTSDGRRLGQLELAGPRDDRIREAAVEIARDAAPERSLAIESLRFSLSDAAAPNDAKKPSPGPANFGVALMGRGTLHLDTPAGGGGGALAGLLLGRGTRLTLGAAGEAGGSGAKEFRNARGGVGLSWGAPFEPDSVLGFGLEVGVDVLQTYKGLEGGPIPAGMVPAVAAVTRTAAYAGDTLYVQWPRGSVRPFLAIATAFANADPTLSATAELGLTLGLF